MLSKIDEYEKQPAYKRQGIDLDSSKPGEGKDFPHYFRYR